MKKKIALVVVLALVLVSTIVLAANGDKVTAIIRSTITIVLDGNVLNMKDVNGNKVDPIIIDGTTYLPLRALGETLGKKVTWNGDTQTITLGDLEKTNLTSIVSFIKYGDLWAEIVKGAVNLQFDNIGDTGVTYNTAIKLKELNSYAKDTKLQLSQKYQYMDCDVIYIGETESDISIQDVDTGISVLSATIKPNKIYHYTGLEITNISKMGFKADGSLSGENEMVYFLNPVVY